MWLLGLACVASVALRLTLDSAAAWQTIPARALLQWYKENAANATFRQTPQSPPAVIHDRREVDLLRRTRLLNTVAAVDGLQGGRSSLSWKGKVYFWPSPLRAWTPTEWRQGQLTGPALLVDPTEFRSPLGWTAILFLCLFAASTASLTCAAAVTLGLRHTMVLVRAWFANKVPPPLTSACLRVVPACLGIVLLVACVLATLLWYFDMPRPSLGAVPAPAYLHLWWWPKWFLATWILGSCTLVCILSRPPYRDLTRRLRAELQTCPQCGYPLPSASQPPICPECGPRPLATNTPSRRARLALLLLITSASLGLGAELWFLPLHREFFPVFRERPVHTHDGWLNELLGRWHAAEDGIVLLLPRDAVASVDLDNALSTLRVSARSDSPGEVAPRGGAPRQPGVVISLELTGAERSHLRTIVTQPFFWDNVGLIDSKGGLIQDPMQAMACTLDGRRIEVWAFAPDGIAIFVQCDNPANVNIKLRN